MDFSSSRKKVPLPHHHKLDAEMAETVKKPRIKAGIIEHKIRRNSAPSESRPFEKSQIPIQIGHMSIRPPIIITKSQSKTAPAFLFIIIPQ
jgi:hypothetical protein